MKRFFSFFLIFCMGVVQALAMSNFDVVPPASWAKVESLAHGADISVKIVSGDRMEGEYVGLDAEAIHLRTGSQERAYPRRDIAEVYLLNVSDPNTDGTLGGLGIGAGFTSIFALLAGGREYPGVIVIAAGIGGGIGALIGYVTDNLTKGSELIYRAPANE